MIDPGELNILVNNILNSKKYRDLNIPSETVTTLLLAELERFGKQKPAVKSTKQKLHNIVAAYLGDPDYQDAIQVVHSSMAAENPQQEAEMCTTMLNYHASTRERLPMLPEFYQMIFSITGKPASIIDLACGLHPFGIPWMELPDLREYHAYDLHEPRTRLIQAYFDHQSFRGVAHHQDILLNYPQEQADIAFLFKETHRMEKREKDCNLGLWTALQVNWLVVTLPAISLNQGHDLRVKHVSMVEELLAKTDEEWHQVQAEVNNELIFCLKRKSNKFTS